MPSTHWYWSIEQNINHKLLELFRKEARAQMIRDGFSAGAFKFDEVVNRRAMRRYQERSK